MKKIVLLFLVLALPLVSLQAQEAVVAEVLAGMPAKDSAVFAGHMAKLAAEAPASVTCLAGMLRPASEGVNSPVEYALSGIAAYASHPAHADVKAAVLNGFQDAAGSCEDPVNKAFLESQARLLGPEQPIQAAPQPQSWTRKEAREMVLDALRSGDRIKANTVLGYADEAVGPKALVRPIRKAFDSLSDEAKTDVLNWIGRNRLTSLQKLVKKGLTLPGEAGEASVRAAALLGGKANAKRLLSLLEQDSPLSEAAYSALKAFNGDIRPVLSRRLAKVADPDLVKLAGERHLTASANRIFDLLDNPDTHEAALEALSGVATPKDAARIATLIGQAEQADVEPLQKALSAALHTLPAEEACSRIVEFLPADTPSGRLYPVLAATGTDEAVQTLATASAAGDAAASEALLGIDNSQAGPALLDLAQTRPEQAGKALDRYLDLLSAYEADPERRCDGIARVLSMTDDEGVRTHAVRALSSVPTPEAFALAGKQLDNPVTAYAAASSVRAIAAKCADQLDGALLKTNLKKAIAIFAATGDADDGYAVDELRKILNENH